MIIRWRYYHHSALHCTVQPALRFTSTKSKCKVGHKMSTKFEVPSFAFWWRGTLYVTHTTTQKKKKKGLDAPHECERESCMLLVCSTCKMKSNQNVVLKGLVCLKKDWYQVKVYDNCQFSCQLCHQNTVFGAHCQIADYLQKAQFFLCLCLCFLKRSQVPLNPCSFGIKGLLRLIYIGSAVASSGSFGQIKNNAIKDGCSTVG